MSAALHALIRRNAERAPGKVALRRKHRGIWHEQTWADLSARGDPSISSIAAESLPAAPGLPRIDSRDEIVSLQFAAEHALIAAAVEACATINFPESEQTLRSDLREIGPTVLVAEAPFWDDLHAMVQARMSRASRLNRFLYRSLIQPSLLSGLLLYRPLKDRLGLRRVRAAAVPGAPPSPEAARFFADLGVPLQTEAR